MARFSRLIIFRISPNFADSKRSQNIAVSNLIRESKVHQIDAYLRSGEQASRGMCGLEESLMRLVRERRITASEALSHSNEPEALRAVLGSEAA